MKKRVIPKARYIEVVNNLKFQKASLRGDLVTEVEQAFMNAATVFAFRYKGERSSDGYEVLMRFLKAGIVRTAIYQLMK